MSKFLKSSAITMMVIAAISLSGCSTVSKSFSSMFGWVHDDTTDKEEKRLEKLEVPPELSRVEVTDSMALPGGLQGKASYSEYTNKTESKELVKAKGSGFVLPQGVAIKRAGETRWLEITANANALYGKVKKFLENQELDIDLEEKRLMFIDTSWAPESTAIPKGFFSQLSQNIFGSPILEKYRFRIEPGLEDGVAELYVSHYGVEKVLIDEVESGNVLFEKQAGDLDPVKSSSWRPRPVDKALEAEMLRRFIVYIGVGEDIAEQMVEQPVDEERLASIVADQNGYALSMVIKQRFFNSWRIVGKAIDHASFTLLDRNRSGGEFFVQYDPSAEQGSEEKGFWESIMFWRDAKEHIKSQKFYLRLVDEGDKCRMVVLDEDKKVVDIKVARVMLRLLNEHIY
ncbi:MAG: outer membrane protein assembly factor BamC [Gammaproteobacteria bacterium]|mgnify:CR=1 FL=1|nr:MAG: outer membrane protein assembly factor BamC [Gammaproteobacteria bacterium]